MSQSIIDKIINHYVARFILIPKLEKYLSYRNCATRKNMGTSYAIKLLKHDLEYFKRYDSFYILKLDIKKYFYNIDHSIILKMIEDEFNEKEYNLIKSILDSTNKEYINKKIEVLEKKEGIKLPRYNYNKGLAIGSMTNQFFAIFYLDKLQHFIRHDMHLRFINYMDDYIIIHQNKEYLKYCLSIIKEKLNNEYKLEVNENKTFIVNAKYGFDFLGYNFKVINKKTIIKLNQNSKKNIRKGLKRTKYLYKQNRITLNQAFCSFESIKNSYIFANHKEIENMINYYWDSS